MRRALNTFAKTEADKVESHKFRNANRLGGYTQPPPASSVASWSSTCFLTTTLCATYTPPCTRASSPPLSIPSMSSLLLLLYYYPRDDRGEIPGSAIGEGLPSHVNSSTRRLLSSSTTCIGIAVHYHHITINHQQHGIVNRDKGVLMSWAR